MTELCGGANKASGPESASYELAINSTHYNIIVLFIEEQICCCVSAHVDKEVLKIPQCNIINKSRDAS